MPGIFFRIIWSMIIPFLYVITILGLYFISIKIKIMKSHKIYLYNGFTFTLLFMQPNIVSILIGSSACRNIDNKLYIKEDIRYDCYNSIHNTYLVSLILPFFLLWAFVVPLLILRSMIKNKGNLNKLKVRFMFGFLY